jgi:hypothetical protein
MAFSWSRRPPHPISTIAKSPTKKQLSTDGFGSKLLMLAAREVIFCWYGAVCRLPTRTALQFHLWIRLKTVDFRPYKGEPDEMRLLQWDRMGVAMKDDIAERFPKLTLQATRLPSGEWIIASPTKPLTEDEAGKVVVAYQTIQELVARGSGPIGH